MRDAVCCWWLVGAQAALEFVFSGGESIFRGHCPHKKTRLKDFLLNIIIKFGGHAL